MDGLEFEYASRTLTVRIGGELDHHLASGLRERIDDEFFEKKPAKLRLDLSSVDFMDSSGLGLIMGRYARAKAASCAFSVVGLNERGKKLLSMSGMDKLITFE